jgi:hypothetical protein
MAPTTRVMRIPIKREATACQFRAEAVVVAAGRTRS